MKDVFDYRELVIRFFTGEITDSDMYVLKEWLEADQSNRRIFDEENEVWQKSGINTGFDHFETDKAWTDLSTQLGIGRKKVKQVIILRKYNFRILIAAASIAFLVGIAGLTLWLAEPESVKQLVIAPTIVRTDHGEKTRILLADSTRVILNSGSSLEYTTDYNVNKRVVKLKGEAFFNVRTNPEKPFIVQLGEMSVSATGTRFNVSSYEKEDRIETTLEEGNIHIDISGQESIEVKTGQQVVYFTKTNKAIVREVVTENYTSWKENKLRFTDTPLEEVLRKIGRKYNVSFEIRNRELLELKYTGTFIDESIEDVMQMLKTISPINYKIYNRTTINDKQYIKPKIVVDKKRGSRS